MGAQIAQGSVRQVGVEVVFVVVEQARRGPEEAVEKTGFDCSRGAALGDGAASVVFEGGVLTVDAETIVQWIEREQREVVQDVGVETSGGEQTREQREVDYRRSGEESEPSACGLFVGAEAKESPHRGDADEIAQDRPVQIATGRYFEEVGIRVAGDEEAAPRVVGKMGARRPDALRPRAGG
jgi:hypothetical protein